MSSNGPISFDDFLSQQQTASSQEVASGTGKIKPKKEQEKEERQRRKKEKSKKFFSLLLKILVVIALGIGMWWVTLTYIFPPVKETNTEASGSVAIKQFQQIVNSAQPDRFEKGSYLAEEFLLANVNEHREEFIEGILGTVNYNIPKIQAINTLGEPVFDENDQPVMVDSEMVNGETLTMTQIDYKAIEDSLDPIEIQKFARENKFDLESIDYVEDLTDLFVKYVNSLDELPTKEVEWRPSVENTGLETESGFPIYRISDQEDKNLDEALFATWELHKLQDTFSKMVNPRIEISPEWIEWSKENIPTAPPKEIPQSGAQSSDFTPVKPLEIPNEILALAPPKYDAEKSISRDWIGSTRLEEICLEAEKAQSGPSIPCGPRSGDGSEEHPANVGTPVITAIIEVDEDGKVTKTPIKVTLLDIKEEKEAVDWLEALDVRNRGLDVFSKVEVIGVEFLVENLGTKEITIYDNSSLADYNANLLATTGKMYGLTTEVTLKPKESEVIHTWVASQNPNALFLVWGADFARREPVVWFDVLRAHECLPKECGVRGQEAQSGAIEEEKLNKPTN